MSSQDKHPSRTKLICVWGSLYHWYPLRDQLNSGHLIANVQGAWYPPCKQHVLANYCTPCDCYYEEQRRDRFSRKGTTIIESRGNLHEILWPGVCPAMAPPLERPHSDRVRPHRGRGRKMLPGRRPRRRQCLKIFSGRRLRHGRGQKNLQGECPAGGFAAPETQAKFKFS